MKKSFFTDSVSTILQLVVGLSKNVEENISAFVSRITKSSDRVRIEYLPITSNYTAKHS